MKRIKLTGAKLKPVSDKKKGKLFAVKKQTKTLTRQNYKENFPIIGIGASAGGLAALEEFFSNIPQNEFTGMAFIIVQHLAPDHKSILNELIERYTTMKVFEVTDGITVYPDCVYIIPPNKDMAYLNGKLQLLELDSPRGKRLGIDFFFRSLAQDLHQRAICIILSGTGSDGTEGAKAIKNEGGMVIAQQPESTKFDGMPRSVILSGIVDYILLPKDMPAQLVAYVGHSYIKAASGNKLGSYLHIDNFQKIFVLLRSKTGHDFSLYKPNTIYRRIERRMAVNQIDQLDDYLRYLQKTPIEIDLLFNDLLIGVTGFFRDKEAFRQLEKKIIPKLFEGKPDNSLVRVWVPGCSTGEEAYSIAILLQEMKNTLKKSCRLQVFATDIDGKAIQQARSGVFSGSIKADIEPGRLSRYFVKGNENDTYKIQKEIRDILIFSEHNVIKDPPFSNLDLISCRNMLIYFSNELQKKIVPLFHYALNLEGYLFLGSSETIGEFINLFSIVDTKAKIYKLKIESNLMKKQGIPKFLPGIGKKNDNVNVSAKNSDKTKKKYTLQQISEKELLTQYTPASVIVNKAGDIQFLHGRTGLFLEPAPGENGMNVIKMAREGLKHELISSLQKVVINNNPVTVPNLKIKTNGDYCLINLTIKKINNEDSSSYSEELYLIIFQKLSIIPAEEDPDLKLVKHGKPDKSDSGSELIKLRKELKEKEAYLQNTLEAMETSNEELRSINEELQSVNEEFQSTNEELETSREELQSVNEELATVNAELQLKVSDLSRSYNDMSNLLAGTDIGTIFVDNNLLIQRFTPAVTKVINLISTDVGRPISHIVSNLAGYSVLIEDIKEVLNTLVPKEIEVQTNNNSWYVLSIRPYRTSDNVIDGAVITFFDSTEIKKARDTIHENEIMRHLAVVVLDSSDAIIVSDLNGKITTWNPSAQRIYGWNESEALSMNIRQLIPEEIQEQEITILNKLISGDTIQPYPSQRLSKTNGIVDVMITANGLISDDGNIYALSSIERKLNK